MNNLRDRLKRFNSTGDDFFENRKKGFIQLDYEYMLENYKLIKTDLGESIAFHFKNRDAEIFYGTPTVTIKFKEFLNEFNKSEVEQLLQEGLKIVFKRAKSQNNRYYTTFNLY